MLGKLHNMELTVVQVVIRTLKTSPKIHNNNPFTQTIPHICVRIFQYFKRNMSIHSEEIVTQQPKLFLLSERGRALNGVVKKLKEYQGKC